ncbi:MAG: DUF4230 domain-containing protein [Armatimonadetes bacterium]|nr:DUF4230 domain-containing protein [Armatimonadota bacterium]
MSLNSTRALVNTAIAAGIVLVLAASASFYLSLRSSLARPKLNIDASRTEVIRQIRGISRLETASFTVEKIIEAGTDGNVFQEILYGDRILLIAHGEVVAGFDLSGLSGRDVRITQGSLTLNLPPPRILFVRLDNSRTRVYDRKRGLLSRGDKDLESKARVVAENSIRSAACEGGILSQASKQAARQLAALFRSAGFESVRVNIPDTVCD